MRLAGKTALITGGNSGIGLATAKLFVAEGANVAITGRNQVTLDAAVAELGKNALAVRAEVTDPQAAEQAVAATVKRFGNLDIVFANAGISGSTPIGDTTAAAFDAILHTNLTGVFLTVQAAVPHLRAGASVVLVGSVHAVLGAPGAAAYAASKAGIRAMTRVLASELAPRGIRVNGVTPGATRTPIWDNRAPTPEAFAALEARMNRAVPSARISEAEEIAQAVLFLASSDSANMTAAELVVDGGLTGAPAGAPIYRA
jgi:NAD(P)-dependent dehydrogenase (short-subunit alcohol dehydrogenase family)